MNEFKHMMPDEALVWQRWLTLAQLPGDIDVSYDVAVGEAIKLTEDFPEPFRGMATFLSKKRIDAVLTFPDRILIVEVKKVVSWAAVGQLLGYPVLFDREFHPTLPLTVLLVAESFPLDLQLIFDTIRLPYDIIPPDATAIISGPPEEPPAEPPT